MTSELEYMICFTQADKIKYYKFPVIKTCHTHTQTHTVHKLRIRNKSIRQRHHLGSVKVMLKSQSFFANSTSLDKGLGFAMLLSEKYSPLTPFTCGCNAT